eukprot:Rmarinus@m.29842
MQHPTLAGFPHERRITGGFGRPSTAGNVVPGRHDGSTQDAPPRRLNNFMGSQVGPGVKVADWSGATRPSTAENRTPPGGSAVTAPGITGGGFIGAPGSSAIPMSSSGSFSQGPLASLQLQRRNSRPSSSPGGMRLQNGNMAGSFTGGVIPNSFGTLGGASSATESFSRDPHSGPSHPQREKPTSASANGSRSLQTSGRSSGRSGGSSVRTMAPDASSSGGNGATGSARPPTAGKSSRDLHTQSAEPSIEDRMMIDGLKSAITQVQKYLSSAEEQCGKFSYGRPSANGASLSRRRKSLPGETTSSGEEKETDMSYLKLFASGDKVQSLTCRVTLTDMLLQKLSDLERATLRLTDSGGIVATSKPVQTPNNLPVGLGKRLQSSLMVLKRVHDLHKGAETSQANEKELRKKFSDSVAQVDKSKEEIKSMHATLLRTNRDAEYLHSRISLLEGELRKNGIPIPNASGIDAPTDESAQDSTVGPGDNVPSVPPVNLAKASAGKSQTSASDSIDDKKTKADMKQQKAQIRNLTDELKKAENEISTLKNQLTSKDELLSKASKKSNKNTTAFEDRIHSLGIAKAAAEAEAKASRKEADTARANTDQAKAEIDRVRKDVEKVRKELAKAMEDAREAKVSTTKLKKTNESFAKEKEMLLKEKRSLSLSVADMENTIATLSEGNRELKRELEAYEKSAGTQEKVYVADQLAVENLKRQIEDLTASRRDFEGKLVAAEKEKSKLSKKLSETEKESKSDAKELVMLKQQLEVLNNDREAMMKSQKKLRDEGKEVSSLKNEVQRLKSASVDHDGLMRQKRQWDEEKTKYEEDLESLRERFSSADKENTVLSDKVEQLQQEVEALSGHNTNLSNQLLTQTDSLRQEVKLKTRELETVTLSLEEIKVRDLHLEKRVHELENMLNIARSAISSAEDDMMRQSEGFTSVHKGAVKSLDDAHNQAVLSLRQARDQALSQVEDLEKMCEDLRRDVRKARSQLSDATTESEKWKTKHTATEKRLQEANASLSTEKEMRLALLKKCGELQGMVEGARTTGSEVSSAVLTELNSVKQQLEERTRSLEEVQKLHKKELEAKTQLVNTLKSKLDGQGVAVDIVPEVEDETISLLKRKLKSEARSMRDLATFIRTKIGEGAPTPTPPSVQPGDEPTENLLDENNGLRRENAVIKQENTALQREVQSLKWRLRTALTGAMGKVSTPPLDDKEHSGQLGDVERIRQVLEERLAEKEKELSQLQETHRLQLKQLSENFASERRRMESKITSLVSRCGMLEETLEKKDRVVTDSTHLVKNQMRRLSRQDSMNSDTR